ncbi:class I SAM-dependent methyltransferase [uncultured Umboniibacter sp.]|uniref:class I SAM-dependent methyltransferase n=1 Tax=uncultured Umboniibacter sp. TaxID=1798917 RepID=UPI00260811BB|nr:class I SAM-dependent methyltransferase [uncultured Umboniibacter sp.]
MNRDRVAYTSLERIYPQRMDPSKNADKDAIELHQSRYRFASQQLIGDRILDLACGCGYGTALMAEAHPDKTFVGVDIDETAILYARQHYQRPNLSYLSGDATKFASNQYFDTLVSLETIEHLPSVHALLENFSKLLRVNGKLIASVPTTPTCDGNPHHLHDFSERSFKHLLRQFDFQFHTGFEQVQEWVYDDLMANELTESTSRAKGVGRNLLKFYLRRPWALITRFHALLVHGRCNKYLTGVFIRHASQIH